ncbi:MAG: hypothetical protein RL328_657 [Acidobacteriota bacterium]|jgi:hypothetical protein
MKHPFETELALFATGDLPFAERLKTWAHVRGCNDCRARVEAFRLDQQRWQDSANELPPGVNWDRLASEMKANIRVGLAAGECVSNGVEARPVSAWNWKPVAVVAGLMVVFTAAWTVNLPSSDLDTIQRAWNRVRSGKAGIPVDQDSGPVVSASSKGIEFRENGAALGVSTGKKPPVAVSVSFSGSASARYVDDDTGQVTIATVYTQ